MMETLMMMMDVVVLEQWKMVGNAQMQVLLSEKYNEVMEL
jgi:hypothetical protein